MASVTKTGSWNGNLGGQTYWGLSRQVGPWKSTPLDEVRAASRPGYPYANAGTAFSASSIHPYIQTLPPVKLGFNVSDIYIEPDYSTPQNAIPKKSSMGPKTDGGRYVMDKATGFWKRVFGKKFGKDKDERGINRAPDIIPTTIKRTGVNLADKVAVTATTNTEKQRPNLRINTNLFEMNAVLGSPITPSVVGTRSSGAVSSHHASAISSMYGSARDWNAHDVSMGSASSASSGPPPSYHTFQQHGRRGSFYGVGGPRRDSAHQ